MTLAEGRVFDDRDAAHAGFVVIVNETMARRSWPQGRAIGRRLKLGAPSDPVPWRTVVGVLRDVRSMGLDQPSRAELYFPHAQSDGNWMWPRDLVLRADGDPRALARAVRAAVWSIDPSQPVSNVQTMDEIVDKEVVQRRTQTRLLGAFAALALVLACLGIYGVLSLLVSERTEEIGVRLALGATQASVLRLVVGNGMRLALTGVVAGLIGHGGRRGSWSACSTASGLTRRCSSPGSRCCCSACRSSPSFCQPVGPAASIRCARYVRSRCRVHADSSGTH